MSLILRSRSVDLAPRTTKPSVSPRGFRSKADTPMVQLNKRDVLRARDLFEGTQIVGGTGSGKSSGSGKAIAHAMLLAGWGGLVLCAKPDEADRWEGYATETGRAAHVIRMRPEGPYNINFMEHAVHQPGGGGAEGFNLVALLEVLMNSSSAAMGQDTGGDGSPFWPMSRRECATNLIEPLVAATGRVRFADIMQMITSAPNTEAEAYSAEWKSRSTLYAVLNKAFQAPAGRPLPVSSHRASADYWFSTWAKLDGRTRSNIVATLTSALSPFLRGVLHERFSTTTNVIPELTHEGAIIIFDFSVKQWGAAAVVASQLMKYQWQRATERRRVNRRTRPVFLFADECQFYLSEYDAEFQSTARSSLAATVYITQNLPTYYAQLRARDAKSVADSLLGNFQTKIFHANTDPTTNNYASELIGRSLQRRDSANWSSNTGYQSSENWGSNWGYQRGRSSGRNWGQTSSFGSSSDSHGGSSSSSSSGNSSGGSRGTSSSRSYGGSYGQGESHSRGNSGGGGWSEQMDLTIQPSVFASRLRKGGKAERNLVDAIVVQGGRNFWLTDAHWLPCTFKQ